MIPDVQIHIGEVRAKLDTLAEKSVNAIVTSPPYWGLRNYGTAPVDWPAGEYAPLTGVPPVRYEAWRGELGLEPDPIMFVGHIVEVFRRARHALRDDGTLWVNFGDCYVDGGRGSDTNSTLEGSRRNQAECRKVALRTQFKGLAPKNLVFQPARVALALQADGWILRKDIIWHKKNPMPESCRDRPTNAHEYVFLFSKSKRYHYDAKAIKEPVSGTAHPRRSMAASQFPAELFRDGNRRRVAGLNPKAAAWPAGWDSTRGDGGHGKIHRLGREGPNSRMHDDRVPLPRKGDRTKQHAQWAGAHVQMVKERNCRDVWSIATQPYRGAHFATFPIELVRRPILAGCPLGGVVLDPFGGSGTTAACALQYGRSAILIDLNPANEALMRERVAKHVGQGVLI